MKTTAATATKSSLPSILRFVIPSLIGVFFFMTPVPVDGELTIPIAILSNFLQSVMGQAIPIIMTYLVVLAAAGTIFVKTVRPSFVRHSPFLASLFDVAPVWALCASCCVLLQALGPFRYSHCSLPGANARLIAANWRYGFPSLSLSAFVLRSG